MDTAANYLNKTQLARLGWTPALIKAVLGDPDRVETQHKGYKRWTVHLYLESRVQTGMAAVRFVQAQERRRARKTTAERRIQEIPRRYVDRRGAVPDAAAVMFSLNRFAKHRACTESARVEIYQLKNRLIEKLYGWGYCIACWLHLAKFPPQVCRECDGSGGAGECERCGGSGEWRSARVVTFWCFRFLIEDKHYTWHQPKETVEFVPVATAMPADWLGIAGVKPMSLPRAKFAGAKALLRWVVEGDVPAQAAIAEDACQLELCF